MSDDVLETDWLRYGRHLKIMRLEVTRLQWDEGLALLALHGVLGSDASTALYAFLYRLTPFWAAQSGWIPTDPPPPLVPFVGWQQTRQDLVMETRGMDQEERFSFLRSAFGTDALRVAVIATGIA